MLLNLDKVLLQVCLHINKAYHLATDTKKISYFQPYLFNHHDIFLGRGGIVSLHFVMSLLYRE